MNADKLAGALRLAFNLGQTYWRQADSEYPWCWEKADATRAKFDTLVAETLAEHDAQPAQAAQPKTLAIFTANQAQMLLDSFGGSPATYALIDCKAGECAPLDDGSPSPAGLYVYDLNCPEEGVIYLGDEDEDSEPRSEQAAQPKRPRYTSDELDAIASRLDPSGATHDLVGVAQARQALRYFAAAPQPPAQPALHPATADLVRRFSVALAEKLTAAEQKYGYSDNWARPGWMDECRQHLLDHIVKGDPRDVAAYCAFLWHHGERTSPAQPSADAEDAAYAERVACLACVPTSWLDPLLSGPKAVVTTGQIRPTHIEALLNGIRDRIAARAARPLE